MRKKKPAMIFMALLALGSSKLLRANEVPRQHVPLDLVEMNWRGANYLQSLTHPTYHATAFNEDSFLDARGLNQIIFLDDTGRVVRSFAEEAEYSPVARVEAIATLADGLLKSKIPATTGQYFFAIDNRVQSYLKPDGKTIDALWLQDESTSFMTLIVERKVGDAWEAVDFSGVAPLVSAEERSFSKTQGDLTIRGLARAGIYDAPPALTLSSTSPTKVRVRIATKAKIDRVWWGKKQNDMRVSSQVAAGSGARYLLLHRDAKRSMARSTGAPIGKPESYTLLDSMYAVAWSAGKPLVTATAKDGQCEEVQLEFDVKSPVTLRVSPFLEVLPFDCNYVHAISQTMADKGVFGVAPYSPVRTSNNFMGGIVGLASAAWVLKTQHHAMAPRVLAAANTAINRIIAAQDKGYYGEYGYNAIEAMRYLVRLQPEKRATYVAAAKKWADRTRGWIVPGSAGVSWNDTTLRAVRCWQSYYELSGDTTYRDLARAALDEFALPATGPIHSFTWRGNVQPAESNVNPFVMLFGELSYVKTPGIADAIGRVETRLQSDYGLCPEQVYTADDLLPYFIGRSLPAAFGDRFVNKRKTPVPSMQYIGYDADGKTWKETPPAWVVKAAARQVAGQK